MDARDRDEGGTALFWCIAHYNHTSNGDQLFTIIKQLIALGADVNIPTNHGLTPLMTAADNGILSVVEMLIEA